MRNNRVIFAAPRCSEHSLMIGVEAIYKDNSIGMRDPDLAPCCNEVIPNTVNAAEAERHLYLQT